ncbi:hypothetical protein BASA61_000498 [Batrachochytrium salamandrivorans]|nr:hypothetical protein BASA61_000498 [Batrachochytrium salamandrivorans]
MHISIATVCSVAIFALPSVTAWGKVAHRVIGLIAKQFLTKEGLEYVDAYLHQQSMDSIGSWADNDRESYEGYDAPEYRKHSPILFVWTCLSLLNSRIKCVLFSHICPITHTHAWSKISPPPWIPSEAKCVYDDHRDCADGICLSSAIARHNRILMESTSPDDPGAEESMKYIIHYVSDMMGGSLTKVRFANRFRSLHTIWDTHIPEKRVLDDFQGSEALYASYLIRNIKTGENKVLSESWTSKLPIDAVNDIGNSVAAIEYTADSYELSCSVAWANYNEHREKNLGSKYYGDFFKTVDMQISKAGLRVAKWLNDLAQFALTN